MDSLDLFVYLKHGYIERNYYNSMLRNCLAWKVQQRQIGFILRTFCPAMLSVIDWLYDQCYFFKFYNYYVCVC